MLEQVERNKRPEGTVRLATGEIKEIRENLNLSKKQLFQDIEKMSVSLFTTRAKRQASQITNQLNEVERALTVFEREKVFVK